MGRSDPGLQLCATGAQKSPSALLEEVLIREFKLYSSLI